MCAISVIFTKIPKVMSRPMGENSPNLVTLSATNPHTHVNPDFISDEWNFLETFHQKILCFCKIHERQITKGGTPKCCSKNASVKIFLSSLFPISYTALVFLAFCKKDQFHKFKYRIGPLFISVGDQKTF
jgi:hypothetical protein